MRTILSFCSELPVLTFEPGAVLLAEGASTGVLYVLVEGEIEVVKGDFQITSVTEPGSIFGETSVLLGMPHTATVKTVTTARVHVVRNAEAFLQERPEITYQLARLLAQRLHGVTTYLVDLKQQFKDAGNHLGMVDIVLETLVHQQNEDVSTGSDRDPTM